jgi:hypothetical protein
MYKQRENTLKTIADLEARNKSTVPERRCGGQYTLGEIIVLSKNW